MRLMLLLGGVLLGIGFFLIPLDPETNRVSGCPHCWIRPAIAFVGAAYFIIEGLR